MVRQHLKADPGEITITTVLSVFTFSADIAWPPASASFLSCGNKKSRPHSGENERVRKPCTHCVSISRKFLIGFVSKAICSAGTRQRDEPRSCAQGRAFVYRGLQVLNLTFSVSGLYHTSWKKASTSCGGFLLPVPSEPAEELFFPLFLGRRRYFNQTLYLNVPAPWRRWFFVLLSAGSENYLKK